MPKVQVLPDHVASQIAAGEVVERPSSVVKELVENAIDAGSTMIEIAISSGCRDIRVADDGSGMSPEDAVLAFHRHATSKLKSADDLWSLKTMGFRGEALPSIASVSRMICTTRTADVEVGTKVEASEGQVKAVETGCAKGSVIEVFDLFYNVPARLKFLRKPATEFAHIFDTVQALAIAYNNVAFSLINDGEVVMRTAGSGQLQQALVESKFFAGQEELIKVDATNSLNGTSVKGFIARPKHFRGDRKGIISIVNNRPVRCPLTLKALDNAYNDLIPRGRYPLAAIFVTIDPAEMDINVHPTKKEIKYTKANDIYLSIYRAIKESISSIFQGSERPSYAAFNAPNQDIAAALTIAEPVATFDYSAPQQLNLSDRLAYVPPAARSTATVAHSAGTATAPRTEPPATLPPDWRLLGYLQNTYFLLETNEGLEIVEQHIAHERVLYERLLAAQKTNDTRTDNIQKLALPLPLDLSREQFAWICENAELLESLGFTFEVKGNSAACTQLPATLPQTNRRETIQAVIESLRVDGTLTDGNLDPRLEATKSIACQSAIKNGMQLNQSDIIDLLSAWDKTPRNDTCPHGRPIRLKLSMEKLFQLFHP
ncbi:MAG: DNA mismatch repair endonuclease MutL [Candidatus Obscuribacterales bacterium]|nr:DNA mismatch repair endonuclease MutL [Candidatus Obscuribacterales bacterium]